MEDKLHGISLCTGIGGLELGLSIAIGSGYECVGYCERESFASSVIVARMEEKALDQAPLYGDLASFPGKLYRGKVDILSAGFPCQPFSVSGLRSGGYDDRYIFDDILRAIDDCDPKILFFENVPGLLSAGGGTCVCGWPDRWGGLHRNHMSKTKVLCTKSRSRDGGNCSSDTESSSFYIRRERKPVKRTNGEMGVGVSMDPPREGGCGFLSLHSTIIENQAKASFDCCNAWTEWREKSRDPRIEPQRPVPQAKWMVCPACGRKVENSSDVIRAFARILGSLADLGFDAEWGLYGAWQVGAPHRRDRIFILAWRVSNAELNALREFAERGRRAARQALEGDAEPGNLEQALADCASRGFGVLRGAQGGDRQSEGGDDTLADAKHAGQRICRPPHNDNGRDARRDDADGCNAELADATGEGLQGTRYAESPWVAFPPGSNTPPESWPEACPQPALRDRSDGSPNRLDELRCLGNSVIPQVAALAFVDLLNKACK